MPRHLYTCSHGWGFETFADGHPNPEQMRLDRGSFTVICIRHCELGVEECRLRLRRHKHKARTGVLYHAVTQAIPLRRLRFRLYRCKLHILRKTAPWTREKGERNCPLVVTFKPIGYLILRILIGPLCLAGDHEHIPLYRPARTYHIRKYVIPRSWFLASDYHRLSPALHIGQHMTPGQHAKALWSRMEVGTPFV